MAVVVVVVDAQPRVRVAALEAAAVVAPEGAAAVPDARRQEPALEAVAVVALEAAAVVPDARQQAPALEAAVVVATPEEVAAAPVLKCFARAARRVAVAAVRV
ncbi:MAG TPA: hypothetical protein VGF36_16120 [Rhodopila sp.]